MRKPPLLWITIGTAGLIVIVVAVVILTLRNQSRVYTASGAVDLNHPQTSVVLATAARDVTPATITNPIPEPIRTDPAVQPTLAATSLSIATVPPTPIPTKTPQPTLQPATAILYDDFTALTSGWSPLYVDTNGNFNGYSTGGYHIDAGQPDALLYDVENRLQWSAGRYAVDVQFESGTGTFGLLLGVQGELNQYDSLTFISVGMTEQGEVLIRRHEPGNEQTVAQSPSSSALSVEQQPLRFSVDASPAGLVVLINDAVVLRTADVQIENGYVGVFTKSNGQPLHVGFDNLLAIAQPPSDQPACASIRPLFTVTTDRTPAEGEDVQVLWRRLAHLGYSPYQEKGSFDEDLAATVTLFQTRNDLPPNGIVDGSTWCRLLSDAAIRADTGRTERADTLQLTRPVQFTTLAVMTPLAVSVRQADETWRAALAIPGQNELRYLELGGDALDPTWSPDARTLAFTSNRSGTGAVWLLDLLSGRLRQVTPDDQECQFPSWSPDSRMLIVTCEPLIPAPFAARDFVVDLAGGQLRQLSAEHAGWADWSATNEILYTHWTGKSFDLVRVNPDGSGAINLTNTDDIDEDIAGWSPDGSSIAFVGNPRGQTDQRQIFVMQRDGSGVTAQTSMPGPNSNPVWSPDGRAIVFSNQNGMRLQPWVLVVGSTQPQQISANDDRIWFMNWVQSGS